MKAPLTTKSFILAALLFVVVGVAVSSLAAQEPREPRVGTWAPRVFSLEARGSQLGVTVQDLEPADLAGPVSGGVRIEDVQPDRAAARAGLQPGDIVTAFDEERVRSTRQFSRLVQETPDGRTVAVDILRAGQAQTLQVTPEPRTDAFRYEDLEPHLRELEPRMRELAPRLREMEPRLREQLRTIEPRLREIEPEIRERLDEIERMLRELLEKA